MNVWEIIHQPWLYVTLSLTYFLSIVTVIVVILGENRNPVKSLAWVTILILFPAVGLILYFFFGRNIKNKRMISRRNKRRLRRAVQLPSGQQKRPKGLPEQSEQLAKLAASLVGSPYYTGNKLDIFSDGSDKFDALKSDLFAAQKYINIQYYIFEDDKIGHEIAEILMAKAREGVKVRVIYDHVGSYRVNGKFFKRLNDAGVEAYPFFKVAFIPLASKVNWRNHRKMVIIDGRVGYIGGMNIADRYVDGGKKFKLWRDCHLRVEGSAVAALYYSFARDWNFMGRELLEETPKPVAAGDAGVQLVTGGPMSQWNSLAQIFAKAISSASKRVWIQTPYFLPPEYLSTALQNAALGGVDVRIMIPRGGDSRLLGLASRSYFAELLRAGVKFYMFEPGMLHSKLMIVDDEIATVGSTNFDFRSFEHNFEGNLIIYSADFNQQLQKVFLDDQIRATRIHSVAWKKRPVTQKACESVLRLLSPIL
ncbi:MAG: cardiolipin synthase [Bacteroides sp.]|nr:cardiolipin synthase [Bacteroides sp.]MCM1379882.1 cardiolipin synthase [Bacteroides sp.]MCM1446264.1 cardiolipin synthase [Prevotella sp.]